MRSVSLFDPRKPVPPRYNMSSVKVLRYAVTYRNQLLAILPNTAATRIEKAIALGWRNMLLIEFPAQLRFALHADFAVGRSRAQLSASYEKFRIYRDDETTATSERWRIAPLE